jgi:hypothetical protein
MVEVCGVEIDDAEKIGGSIIERKSKRRKFKNVYKGPQEELQKIRSLTLRKFAWVLKEILDSGKVPGSIEFTILQEVIQKKLCCSKRSAFDYATAVMYVFGSM